MNSENKCYTTEHMKEEPTQHTYLSKDLIRFGLIATVLAGLIAVLYYFDQSTGYFGILAERIYSKLVN